MESQTILARRSDRGLELRAEGLRLRWELRELACADGHAVQGHFACTIRALPDPAERKMLEETLLCGRSAVGIAELSEHFSRCLQSAARGFATTIDAAELLAEQGRAKLAEALMKAGSALAFGCGLELLPPTQLDLDCPSLRRTSVERMERQAQHDRALDQIENMREMVRLGSMLQEVRAAGGLSPGQALQSLSGVDRADVLRATLASGNVEDFESLKMVAGFSLIGLSAQGELEQTPLPQDLGPCRSVRRGEGGLLVGCRNGVLVLDADENVVQKYEYTAIQSPRGFNVVVEAMGRIWAAHGEAGLVSWSVDSPHAPDIIIGPDAGGADFSPRNLNVLDGAKVILSSGNAIFTVSSEGELHRVAQASRDVAGIVIGPRMVTAAQDDGTLLGLDRETLEPRVTRKISGRILAAAAMPWLSDVRLLLAAQDGPILCAALEDDVVTYYASNGPGVRMLAAKPGVLAAASADRQRLILWNAWDRGEPCAEHNVYYLARHRIADIVFA